MTTKTNILKEFDINKLIWEYGPKECNLLATALLKAIKDTNNLPFISTLDYSTLIYDKWTPAQQSPYLEILLKQPYKTNPNIVLIKDLNNNVYNTNLEELQSLISYYGSNHLNAFISIAKSQHNKN